MKLVTMVIAASVLLGLAPVYSQTARQRTAPTAGNRDQESVQTVAKMEDEMRLAALKGDASWWVENLSDGYVGIDSQGKVSNKEQTIAFQRSPGLVYEIWNLSDRDVHIFNGDTVVVTGKVTLEGTYRGQSLSGDFQFTHVWVKNALVWQLAVFQSTKLENQSQ